MACDATLNHDRSRAPRGNAARDAPRHTLSAAGRGASWAALPRRAWERACACCREDRSRAPRGNAARDAPRHPSTAAGRGASQVALPRRAWERACACCRKDRSRAPRGNAALDAPRHTLNAPGRGASGRRYHAERGNEHVPAAGKIAPALRVGMQPVTLRVTPSTRPDAERPGRRYHAERWERADQNSMRTSPFGTLQHDRM